MTIYDIRKAYFFLSITISLAGLCVSVGAQESGEYGAIKIQRTTLPIASVRFRCEPAPGLTAGEVVTAVIAKDGSQAWSIRRERVFVGSDQMSFPAMGMLLASDGTYHTLVLSQVKFLIAISRRKELKDKNYFIYACRDIQDGETLSAYIVGNGDAIILIEACSISTQRETVRVPAALISRQPINADQLAESLYVDFWRRTMKAGKKAQSTKTNYELKTSTFHKYEIESFEFDAGQRMVPSLSLLRST